MRLTLLSFSLSHTGTKIRHKYYHRHGNYLEVDLDIGSASVATAAMKVVGGFAKSWVIDLAFVLQGECGEELPERVLASVRLCRLDLPATPLLRADGREEG